jgi:hypothetical protein
VLDTASLCIIELRILLMRSRRDPVQRRGAHRPRR